MEKLILIIIVILFNTKFVHAEELKEVKYRWYKNVQKDIGYLSFEENSNKYNLYTDKKVIYGGWLNYTSDITNTNIETKTIYEYKELKKVRYLYIYYPVTYLGMLQVDDIKIYNNNEEINYEITCNSCSGELNTPEGLNMISRNATIIVDLINEYKPWELYIDIVINNSYTGFIRTNLNSNIENLTQLYFYKQIDLKQKPYGFRVDESLLKESLYSSEIFSEEKVYNTWYNEVLGEEKLYRNVYDLYNYYTIEKEYYDANYYSSSPSENYIKDENDYITIVKEELDLNTVGQLINNKNKPINKNKIINTSFKIQQSNINNDYKIGILKDKRKKEEKPVSKNNNYLYPSIIIFTFITIIILFIIIKKYKVLYLSKYV